MHNLQTWRIASDEKLADGVTFDWDYSGFHAWEKAYIKIALEMRKRGGATETKVLMEGYKKGEFKGKGQEEVTLKGVTGYAIMIQGRNDDKVKKLIGIL